MAEDDQVEGIDDELPDSADSDSADGDVREPPGLLSDLGVVAESPADLAVGEAALRDAMADAITGLPEREKLVIALKYYEHMTDAEVAEVLGIREGRVRDLQTKAILRMRSQLGVTIVRPATLLGPDGAPLEERSPEAVELTARVVEVQDEVLDALARDASLLYELNPRRFEEVVAQAYRRRGFEVELTPASGDEGVDLYIVRHDLLGRSLHVVQLKRNAAHRKIGPAVVRELLGTVTDKDASTGILLTTSFFTPGARKIESEHHFRLSLQDFDALQQLLRPGDAKDAL